MEVFKVQPPRQSLTYGSSLLLLLLLLPPTHTTHTVQIAEGLAFVF